MFRGTALVRIGIGILLVVAPALSFFQGPRATMRGAALTMAATATVTLAWWVEFAPRSSKAWTLGVLVSVMGGVLISVFVALALGSDVYMILRYLWIPIVRAAAVSGGVCLILSALAGSTAVPQRASRRKRRRKPSCHHDDRSPVLE